MPTPLRVLIVDDGPAAELLVSELRHAGFDPDWHRAETEADYLDHLQHGINLVLANDQRPQLSGRRALELLKQGGLDVPVILLSNMAGEDAAMAAMRQGASDYLVKPRLERLGQSVTQALEATRLRAERRCVEQRLLLQATALETADDAIIITDDQGIILWANPAFTAQSGYTAEEAVGQSPRLLRSGKHPPEFYQKIWTTLLAGQPWRGDITNRTKAGTFYVDEITITPVRSKAGSITHFVAIMNDVTNRRATEEALGVSEQRFREMAETIQDVFWSSSSGDGRQIHYVSPAYEHLWGRSLADLIAQPASWIEAVVPEDQARVLAAQTELAGGTVYRIEYRIKRPDGSVRWIEGRGYPVRNPAGVIERRVGVATDITERKQLNAQLLQAQKMEAIGLLAGGIAHDFNNTLTVINGYAQLLLNGDTPPGEIAGLLRQIYAAGMRAANLTRQLLLFSRQHAINKQVIDLNGHLTELTQMLGRVLGEQIRLVVKLTPGLPMLLADAGMMEQILMNLSVNARDAMPGGGTLTITTTAVRFSDREAALHPGRRPGEFICLTVGDTGCGIAPENLPRIFEPFYTTKPPGEGTGLGLATVFGIVQEHAGWVEIESQPGAGTRIKVLLPPCAERLPDARPAAAVPTGKGSETILLVEDEAPVRELIVMVLTQYGYRVLQAGSGLEALEVWKWHSTRIALLLTDMVMPDDISGPELAERLQTEKPALKVVLMSGYDSAQVDKLYTRRPQTRFIQKPFPPNELGKIVREALDEPVAAPHPTGAAPVQT